MINENNRGMGENADGATGAMNSMDDDIKNAGESMKCANANSGNDDGTNSNAVQDDINRAMDDEESLISAALKSMVVDADILEKMKSNYASIIHYCYKLILGNSYTKKPKEFYMKYKQNIYIETEDGETLGAFLYEPSQITPETQFILFCHGKSTDRFHTSEFFPDFGGFSESRNCVILLMDYRDFADSTGSFHINTVNHDILAFMKFMKARYRTENISIVAHSFGTAITLEYCKYISQTQNSQHLPKCVFLLAPFSSTLNICREFKLYSLLSFIFPDLDKIIIEECNYDNVANSDVVSDRLFLFHGKTDNIIPTAHSVKIQERSNCPLFISEHSHLTIFTDWPVWDQILGLISKKINGL